MIRSFLLLVVAMPLLALSPGCKQPEATPPSEAKPTLAEPTTPTAPEKADPTCVGGIATGTPEKIKIGPTEWELNGSTLKQISSGKKKKLLIGALTDIKESTDENQKNLRQIVEWFGKQKVDLIVVAGDTGENETQMGVMLDILATSKVPVFNIIGNREGKTAYRKAMVAARAKHGNIFDLNIVRRVDMPAVDLISMPGYFNPSYVHSDDGCPYYEKDLEELSAVAASCDSPVILVSHGGPRQQGEKGLDRTAEGANVGDPGLAKVMAASKIPFGIFGNIHEAGGNATDLSGKTQLEQGKPYETLYLNPGPVDGVRWIMNDGSESIGMAGLLTLEGGKASYQILRISDGKKKVARRGGGKKKGR